MSTTPAPPSGSQGARPDPETLTDSTASAITPRVTANSEPGLATAIAERDQYDDARKAQFLSFRRWLVPSLFALTVAWLVFVGYIILREELQHGRLSDAVLIALLGTATANVLGLLVIVLKSIFPLDVDRGDG